MCELMAPRCGSQANNGQEEGPLGCYSPTPCSDSRPLGAGGKHTIGGRKAPSGATLAHHVQDSMPLGAGGKNTIGGRKAPIGCHSRTPCANSWPLGAGAKQTMGRRKAPSGATPAHLVPTQGPSVLEASTPLEGGRPPRFGEMFVVFSQPPSLTRDQDQGRALVDRHEGGEGAGQRWWFIGNVSWFSGMGFVGGWPGLGPAGRDGHPHGVAWLQTHGCKQDLGSRWGVATPATLADVTAPGWRVLRYGEEVEGSVGGGSRWGPYGGDHRPHGTDGSRLMGRKQAPRGRLGADWPDGLGRRQERGLGQGADRPDGLGRMQDRGLGQGADWPDGLGRRQDRGLDRVRTGRTVSVVGRTGGADRVRTGRTVSVVGRTGGSDRVRTGRTVSVVGRTGGSDRVRTGRTVSVAGRTRGSDRGRSPRSSSTALRTLGGGLLGSEKKCPHFRHFNVYWEQFQTYQCLLGAAGSRWCGSRLWLHLGLRMVRLERPFIGLRIPSRLLCQVWNEVHGAGGNFRCGKVSCCLSVLQDPVRVFTPVDWYGLVGGRGCDGRFSDLVWPWLIGVERGFQLLFEVCIDCVRWLRMKRARWEAALLVLQDLAGYVGSTVMTVRAGSLTGGRSRWFSGYIKVLRGGSRADWKWWRRRRRRIGGLEENGREDAGLFAVGRLEVRDEGDTWQYQVVLCMEFTSWESTWEGAGDRDGPTVTTLLDCWTSISICGNAPMFRDNWGGEEQVKLSGTHLDSQSNPVRCGEFMLPNRAEWNERLIRQVFAEEDAKAILNCPIGPIDKDQQVWCHSSSGIYCVKSGYKWLSKNRGIDEDQSKVWKAIAGLETLPKVKIFSWRLCFEALPLGKKLAAAGLGDGICKICQGNLETGLHAFRECPSLKEAFDLTDLSAKLPVGEFQSCKDWIEAVVESLEKDQFTLFMVLLWNLWNRRNKWIHEAQLLPQRLIVDYAQLLVTDFLNAKEENLSQRPAHGTKRWTKPGLDVIKVNVDGAFRGDSGSAAIGVVARNHQGMMIDGLAHKLEGVHTAASTEACAFKAGILMALENEWQQVVFEGDASSIVTLLESRVLDHSVAAAHLVDILETLKNRPGFSFSHVGRGLNRVAHGLAQWAISSCISFRFDFDLPDCIRDSVLNDAIFG
ncbi:hypothetical protein GQ457_17G007640 [Hibiscus cannabinus]